MTANPFDVLVIGEGLSGITAAAAAARQGARVMLATSGPGTFVLGTAAIDLDGLEAADLGLAGYGAEELREAVEFFVELTDSAGCAYSGNPRERRWIPTVMGTFQEVSLAPTSLWQADPRSLTHAVVAGIESLPGFDASFVAERLAFHSQQLGLSTAYRGVTVKLPAEHERALTTVEIASRLDRDPAYRSSLIAALQPVIGDATLLILPGMLGMKSGDDDLRRFEQDIGCLICELATMPPSVPGLRLLYRLERYLTSQGVELCTGFAVQELCREGDRCTGVVLDTPGRPRRIYADSVVLACGRFSQLLQDHTSLTNPAGPITRLNQELQPVNPQGLIMATNVFGCGSVGGNFAARHGNAIAILTGYQAATLASQPGVHYATR